MLATIFFTHAYQFFFQPGSGAQWYTGNVYGNLVAIIPTGLILFFYIRSRHLAVMESHKALKAAHLEHAAKLDELLDKMDPSTDGGIADLHAALADVQDRLDVQTPGGLADIASKIDALGKPVPVAKSKARKVRSGNAVE